MSGFAIRKYYHTPQPFHIHTVMRTPPLWPLFVRLVSGETTMAEQLERRRVRWLVRLVGG